MANKHTIILMQTSQNRATRTFMDYESISQAMDAQLWLALLQPLSDIVGVPILGWVLHSFLPLFLPRFVMRVPGLLEWQVWKKFSRSDDIPLTCEGICGLYERKLKELNPAVRNITYDIADLYNFIDGLADLSALVYDHAIQAYLPYDRQWVKQRTFQHLKKLALPSTR